MPKVIIRNSHDSDGHRERVLPLTERLRADGIQTISSVPDGARPCCPSTPTDESAGYFRSSLTGLWADIHLHRARLFGSQRPENRGQKYPWEPPAAALAAAERLINACGYHHRDQELADAKQVILGS